MHYKELAKAWDELTGPGGAFEIETIQLRGAPIRAFKAGPPSVRELWLSTAAFAERDYLVYEDERYTYADAHRIVASAANWLASKGVPATGWRWPCATIPNGCWSTGPASPLG